MKTKLSLLAAAVIAAFCFFSFRNAPADSEPGSVLVSLLNGKGDNQGFIITWGDGRIEKRRENVKPLDVDNWVELQSKLAIIVNELNGKGYHYAGSHTLMMNTMVFEKRRD